VRIAVDDHERERIVRTRVSEQPAFREGILLQAFAIQHLSGDLLRAELGDTMSPPRFGVQSVIGALGPITPGELAGRLGMAPTTVSSWIARLEDDGALTRSRNADDGRSVLVELTAKGHEQLREAMPHFRRAILGLNEALGEDVEAVWEAQDRLIAALRARLAASTSS
jgi:DNA-binding MarR family transcriptional regulator